MLEIFKKDPIKPDSEDWDMTRVHPGDPKIRQTNVAAPTNPHRITVEQVSHSQIVPVLEFGNHHQDGNLVSAPGPEIAIDPSQLLSDNAHRTAQSHVHGGTTGIESK